MSQENVEVVRRWLEAISGGSEDFDRALALVHPDIVFVPPGDQAPYRGAESLRRWMEPDAFQEQVVKIRNRCRHRQDDPGEATSRGPRDGQRDRVGCHHLVRLDL